MGLFSKKKKISDQDSKALAEQMEEARQHSLEMNMPREERINYLLSNNDHVTSEYDGYSKGMERGYQNNKQLYDPARFKERRKFLKKTIDDSEKSLRTMAENFIDKGATPYADMSKKEFRSYLTTLYGDQQGMKKAYEEGKANYIEHLKKKREDIRFKNRSDLSNIPMLPKAKEYLEDKSTNNFSERSIAQLMDGQQNLKHFNLGYQERFLEQSKKLKTAKGKDVYETRKLMAALRDHIDANNTVVERMSSEIERRTGQKFEFDLDKHFDYNNDEFSEEGNKKYEELKELEKKKLGKNIGEHDPSSNNANSSNASDTSNASNTSDASKVTDNSPPNTEHNKGDSSNSSATNTTEESKNVVENAAKEGEEAAENSVKEGNKVEEEAVKNTTENSGEVVENNTKDESKVEETKNGAAENAGQKGEEVVNNKTLKPNEAFKNKSIHELIEDQARHESQLSGEREALNNSPSKEAMEKVGNRLGKIRSIKDEISYRTGETYDYNASKLFSKDGQKIIDSLVEKENKMKEIRAKSAAEGGTPASSTDVKLGEGEGKGEGGGAGTPSNQGGGDPPKPKKVRKGNKVHKAFDRVGNKLDTNEQKLKEDYKNKVIDKSTYKDKLEQHNRIKNAYESKKEALTDLAGMHSKGKINDTELKDALFKLTGNEKIKNIEQAKVHIARDLSRDLRKGPKLIDKMFSRKLPQKIVGGMVALGAIANMFDGGHKSNSELYSNPY